MTDQPAAGEPARNRLRRPLGWIVAVGLAARIAAALVVQHEVDRRGQGHCLFPDAEIYLYLADAIRSGAPYAVPQAGGPHLALRTPGYPLFLAVCGSLFGPNPLAARLLQAVLGASTVVAAERLMRRLRPGDGVPTLTAALVAVEPYGVAISALLLSEALFVPLMMLGLWATAAAWSDDPPRRRRFAALGAGLLFGGAILAKPSWALFPPLAFALWAVVARGRSGPRLAAVAALGVAVAMAPWWARNARVYGRFVPTALWAGASLYDGLRPGADGASDMRFLETDPRFRPLGETAQDRALTAESLRLARADPVRVARLAAVKAARYWSPWPNEASFRRPGVIVASALVTVPLLMLMAVGAWSSRGDARALVLLAGPIVYFALVHMVFVSSVRYRIPGSVPALGLAAAGIATARRAVIRRVEP